MSSVPYYPGIAVTPNLGLSLIGMDEAIAQDFVIIDKAFAGGSLLPYVSGLKYRQIEPIGQTTAGDIDLYTVPAGKRALIGAVYLSNYSGSSITPIFKIKVKGTYNTWVTTTGALVNGSQSIYCVIGNIGVASLGVNNPPFILEAGESLSVNSAAQPFSAIASIFEFDATSPFKTARISTWSASPSFNTLYTCPAGKTAFIMAPNLTPFLPTSSVQGGIAIVNTSGGAILSTSFYLVRSGDAPTVNNLIRPGVTVGNNAAQIGFGIPCGLQSGDSIQVQVGSAPASGLMAWCSVLEV